MLYVAALLLLVGFRVIAPVAAAFPYRLRVVEVVQEQPDVVSLRIAGRGLDRLRARAGQFFLWRFLARGRWWAAHPFSLSEAPSGDSLRITVTGDHATPEGMRLLTAQRLLELVPDIADRDVYVCGPPRDGERARAACPPGVPPSSVHVERFAL